MKETPKDCGRATGWDAKKKPGDAGQKQGMVFFLRVIVAYHRRLVKKISTNFMSMSITLCDYGCFMPSLQRSGKHSE